MSGSADADALVGRLRGKVRVPVNDGAGLLNGLDYFERQFPASKLAIEAADLIERQQEALTRADYLMDRLRNAWLGKSVRDMDEAEQSYAAAIRQLPDQESRA